MTSTRQGFFWWEIDLTYYILRGMQKVGLVWELREPPAHVLENRPRRAAPALVAPVVAAVAGVAAVPRRNRPATLAGV
jgi:stearoyl-CoA desaturase (delta-9 desaturase)